MMLGLAYALSGVMGKIMDFFMTKQDVGLVTSCEQMLRVYFFAEQVSLLPRSQVV